MTMKKDRVAVTAAAALMLVAAVALEAQFDASTSTVAPAPVTTTTKRPAATTTTTTPWFHCKGLWGVYADSHIPEMPGKVLVENDPLCPPTPDGRIADGNKTIVHLPIKP